jgi:hypothetical protein
MKDKKPRKMALNIHIMAGDSIEGEWSEEQQRLTIKVLRQGNVVSAEKVDVTTFYQRPKKAKVLNQFEFSRSSQVRLGHVEALSRYDNLWAIDTNNRDIFGKSVNVATVTVCSTDSAEIYYPAMAIIFGQTKDNPELFAWRHFIEFVQSRKQYSAQNSHGLIVDSELSQLPAFNARQIPLCGTFVLPTNWHLIYATADSGKEFLANRALASSDTIATQLLDFLSREGEDNAEGWVPVDDVDNYGPAHLFLERIAGTSTWRLHYEPWEPRDAV